MPVLALSPRSLVLMWCMTCLVRHEAIRAMNVMESAVVSPFAHQISPGLEDSDSEIRVRESLCGFVTSLG
eukprot:45114-Eustigmatos_ZCMA.PRE.1